MKLDISTGKLTSVDVRNTEEATIQCQKIVEKYGEISHLLALHGYVRRHRRFPSHFTLSKYEDTRYKT